MSLNREFDILQGRAVQATKRRNLVEFYIEPYHSEKQSAKAGRPVYVEVLNIRIIVPGDNKQIIERRATEEDKIEYAREWEAYQRSETLSATGTPLEHWSLLGRALVAQFKFFNVHTVDAVAELTDAQVSDMGILGLRTMRNQARAYLETAKTGAVPAALVSDNEQLKEENAKLRNEIRDLQVRFESELKKALGPVAGGAAAANVQTVSVASAQTAKGPAPTVGVPDDADMKRMSDKAVLELATKLSGVKVSRRAEAEEIIAEVRAR
jgi:hypothetical protein